MLAVKRRASAASPLSFQVSGVYFTFFCGGRWAKGKKGRAVLGSTRVRVGLICMGVPLAHFFPQSESTQHTVHFPLPTKVLPQHSLYRTLGLHTQNNPDHRVSLITNIPPPPPSLPFLSFIRLLPVALTSPRWRQPLFFHPFGPCCRRVGPGDDLTQRQQRRPFLAQSSPTAALRQSR